MIIICSTDKKDDVLKGIRQARKTKTAITPMQGIAILQVGKALYNKLKKNTQLMIPTVLGKRAAKHKVNIKTLTLHRATCKYAGKNAVEAAIVNPAKTGLKLCKKCMLK
jgi:hypothetical protein